LRELEGLPVEKLLIASIEDTGAPIGEKRAIQAAGLLGKRITSAEPYLDIDSVRD